jgi:hypothetical protein
MTAFANGEEIYMFSGKKRLLFDVPGQIPFLLSLWLVCRV